MSSNCDASSQSCLLQCCNSNRMCPTCLSDCVYYYNGTVVNVVDTNLTKPGLTPLSPAAVVGLATGLGVFAVGVVVTIIILWRCVCVRAGNVLGEKATCWEKLKWGCKKCRCCRKNMGNDEENEEGKDDKDDKDASKRELKEEGQDQGQRNRQRDSNEKKQKKRKNSSDSEKSSDRSDEEEYIPQPIYYRKLYYKYPHSDTSMQNEPIRAEKFVEQIPLIEGPNIEPCEWVLRPRPHYRKVEGDSIKGNDGKGQKNGPYQLVEFVPCYPNFGRKGKVPNRKIEKSPDTTKPKRLAAELEEWDKTLNQIKK